MRVIFDFNSTYTTSYGFDRDWNISGCDTWVEMVCWFESAPESNRSACMIGWRHVMGLPPDPGKILREVGELFFGLQPDHGRHDSYRVYRILSLKTTSRARYVLVYFSILYIRYRSGIVTEDMLSLPKGPYVVVGLLEALGAASGMAAGAILSGAAIPILSQSFLVWQILFSYIFLGRSYRFNQLFGCFMVALGVIITVASGSGAGSLMEAGVFWSLLMIVSFAFQAADTVLKEIIFLDSSRQLKGGTVDLFVINSYGSAFQALFICLLLPFLSKLWGIPFNQLPNYLRAGAGCFMNNGSISGCEGAPLLPLLFVIVNMGFNISLLYLLKISSAVVSCLASTVSVPISVLLFTLPLPYLGVASSLPSGFVAGAMVLFLGMLIYSWSPTSSSTAPKQSVD